MNFFVQFTSHSAIYLTVFLSGFFLAVCGMHFSLNVDFWMSDRLLTIEKICALVVYACTFSSVGDPYFSEVVRVIRKRIEKSLQSHLKRSSQ